MPVPEGRRADDAVDSRTDLLSLTVGVLELAARGLRLSLGRPVPGEKLFDVTLGAALVSEELASRAVASVHRALSPQAARLLTLLPDRPMLPPAQIAVQLRQRGRHERVRAGLIVERALDLLVPVIVDELVSRIDFTRLVQDRIDLDMVVAGLDLDSVVDAVDLDRAAKRLDVDAVLDRIDLNAVVRDRVDIEAILQTVDIDAVAARVNLDAIIDRLDLPQLAQQVIDEIDLAAIIRESSGSMASEAVRGIRMHSIGADDAVGRALDRVLRHRHGTKTKESGAHGTRTAATAQADPGGTEMVTGSPRVRSTNGTTP